MERTIRSVLAQEYSPLEYLIIDCGMSDEVRALVESHADRVTVISAGAGLSWQEAVNKGAAEASGSLLAWLMPGDCYLPGVLHEVARSAADNPSAGVFVGGGEWCDETGGVLSRSTPGNMSTGSLYHWPDAPFVRGASFVSRDAWISCGPLREEDGDGAELDLWLKIASTFPLSPVPALLVRALAIPATARYRMLADCARVIQRHGGEGEARACLDRLVANFEEQQRHGEQLLAASKRESAEKSQRIEAILSSLSWKVTSPLRALDRGLKSLARKRYEERGATRPLRRVPAKNVKWPDDLPFVSVIIPCFNYGEFVAAAIDSVLAQTFQNLEIIVVDGGSTDDGTLRVLRSLARPKTTVCYREKPCLVGDNRNFGIRMARGKYICCLDADDLLRPTYLEKALFLAESYRYDLVYPSVQCFGGDDRIWHVGTARFPDIARENAVSTVALFSREAWGAVGGYRDWGRGDDHVPEDWDFWARLLAHGYRACRIPEPLMLYRVHGQGLTALNRQPLERHRQLIAEANRELFDATHLKTIGEKGRISPVVHDPFVNLKRRKEGPHILVAVSSLVKGGVDTVLLRLLPFLQEQGFAISVIATVPPLVSEAESARDYEKFSREIYPLYAFLENRDHWKDFIDYLITSRETDIVYQVGCEFLYGLLPELKKAHPCIRIVDQIYNEVWIEGYNRRYRDCIDMTVVENEALAELFRGHYRESAERLCLLPNGVDLESDFVPGAVDATAVRRKYRLPDQCRVIAFLGRFSEEKGPDLFVDILCHLAAYDTLYAVMGGQGPLFPAIQERVIEHRMEGRALLPGFVDSRELLSIADVLVVPSRLDGRPNSILEALAMGVPVVAAAVGGIPGLVSDGATGYLCEPENTSDFAEKISVLLNDEPLRKEMALQARRYAEERLDVRQMLAAYGQLFSGLIGPRR